MNDIEINDFDIDYKEELDRKELLKWINEELEINSKYPFHNNDFNKLPGFELTIVFDLDSKESKRCLHKWILEESFLNPNLVFKKELLRKLPINVNDRGE